MRYICQSSFVVLYGYTKFVEGISRRLCGSLKIFLVCFLVFYDREINSVEMAAKRVATTSIDWVAFGERVTKAEKPYFNALKGRNDSYIRRVAAQPSSLPKIDWNYYKSRISVPGMVDNFQKSYEALNIPYPKDQGLIDKINEQDERRKAAVAKYASDINESVKNLKAELEKLNSQLRYTEMTIEEYFLARPEVALYPNNPPTFFPHGPEEREFTKKLIESGKL